MDERLKILEMVRAGKVTPEQAVELLGALEGGASDGSILASFVDLQDSSPARGLKLTGISRKGSKTSFVIPLGVLKFFDGLFPNGMKINVNDKSLDKEQLMEIIHTGEKRLIYHEETEKGGGVIIELV